MNVDSLWGEEFIVPKEERKSKKYSRQNSKTI